MDIFEILLILLFHVLYNDACKFAIFRRGRKNLGTKDLLPTRVTIEFNLQGLCRTESPPCCTLTGATELDGCKYCQLAISATNANKSVDFPQINKEYFST